MSYVLGSGQMIPEFDKLIVGMKKGDKNRYNHFSRGLSLQKTSGRAVEFDIKVKIVEEVDAQNR